MSDIQKELKHGTPNTQKRVETIQRADEIFRRSVDVEHPQHYCRGKIEVLDFLVDQDFGYLAGNVVKYVSRYRWKGSALTDLKKARFYLERLIKEVEG